MTAAAVPTTLDGALNEAVSLWEKAVKNRHSPLHTPVVCTQAGLDLPPAPRIMVLRAVADAASQFRFHTDARSPKCDHIANGSPIALLGYDPEARVQLTVRGIARLDRTGAAADSAWDASALSSRRCYLAAHPPGTPVDQPLSGLPDHLLNRAPTEIESQEGRPHFAIVTVEAAEMEWLRLTSCGNRRAVFRRNVQEWQGHWITP